MYALANGYGKTTSVLIETLWNVNQNTQRVLYRAEKVLIETLWNVNTVWVCSYG